MRNRFARFETKRHHEKKLPAETHRELVRPGGGKSNRYFARILSRSETVVKAFNKLQGRAEQWLQRNNSAAIEQKSQEIRSGYANHDGIGRASTRPSHQLFTVRGLLRTDKGRIWEKMSSHWKSEFHAGFHFLSSGFPFVAERVFSGIVDNYVYGITFGIGTNSFWERVVDEKTGEQAVRIARDIGRANASSVILATALESGEVKQKSKSKELARINSFFERFPFRKLAYGGANFPWRAIETLALTGEAKDIQLLTELSKRASTLAEMNADKSHLLRTDHRQGWDIRQSASRAIEHILVRSELMKAISSNETALNRLGLKRGELSVRELSERFHPLFSALGLSSLFCLKGGREALNEPIIARDLSEAVHGLKSIGLIPFLNETKFEFSLSARHSPYTDVRVAEMTQASRIFLEKQGVIKRVGKKHKLTEKGAKLMEFLLSHGLKGKLSGLNEQLPR